MSFDVIEPDRNSVKDKRLTQALKDYWDFERSEMPFPSLKQIDQKNIKEIWENCFIVEASNKHRRENYKYLYLGKNIIQAYGEDLTGLQVDKMASPDAGNLERAYERVLATKLPVQDEGEIHNACKQLIKYRQILLPLGDDGVNITAILGGMSYKVFDDGKKFKFFFFGKRS